MSNDDMLAHLRADAWLNAWTSVLQRVDRIMSGKKTVVTISDSSVGLPVEVPAWSDGTNIFLSRKETTDLLKAGDPVAAVLRLKGLNYHELCHVMFTPRSNSPLFAKVVNEASAKPVWMYAFNALEDQRIETWFSSLYGTSSRYFESIVMEWILRNGSAESAILLYGRKYLTAKMRARVGEAFTARFGEALYSEFQSVIDSYLTLQLPGEDLKALSLVRRFTELLEEVESQNGTLPPLVIADNGAQSVNGSESFPYTGQVQSTVAKQALEAAMEAIEASYDADAEYDSDQGEGGDGESSDGDASSPATGTGAGNEQRQSRGTAASGPADSASKTAEQALSDLMDAANEAIEDIEADDAVQSDVEKSLDAVRAVVNNADTNTKGDLYSPLRTEASNDTAKMAVRQTHAVLARIRSAAEPETLFRQTHGRIDARRYISRGPGDIEIFRTYDSGREEEVGVEAAILVDVSGSMHHIMDETSTALWVLKRTFDRLDIATTVLLFDSSPSPYIAYRPGDKAPAQIPVFGAGGGTEPLPALRQALRIMYKSQAANKVLITVTDGQWSSPDADVHQVMRAMTTMNVSSLILGLSGAVDNYGKHHHINGYDLNRGIADLPKAATRLVSDLMMRSSGQ